MEFLSWSMLASSTGALTMVLIITQFTKELPFIKALPTQLWSYIIALLVLYPAHYFTGIFTLSSAILILFNGIIIALAANGGYEAFKRAAPSLFANNQ